MATFLKFIQGCVKDGVWLQIISNIEEVEYGSYGCQLCFIWMLLNVMHSTFIVEWNIDLLKRVSVLPLSMV